MYPFREVTIPTPVAVAHKDNARVVRNGAHHGVGHTWTERVGIDISDLV